MLPAGHNLHSAARARAHAGANSGSLAASRDRPDDGAQRRAPADFLGSIPAPALSFGLVVARHERIALPVNDHVGQFQL